MSKVKLTWQEKLDRQDARARKDGYPKVIEISGKLTKMWGEGTCAVAAPKDVDAIMKTVPSGRLITINQIRDVIAKGNGATIG